MNNIKFIKGNIFNSDYQTLVNTINCVGVMGAGIALEYKYRYPEMFKKYKIHCENNLIQIGKLWIYDIPNSDKKILNFPTKTHWRYPSKYEYLDAGLQNFLNTYKKRGIKSIAFPLLGAQNGKLNIEKVKKIMIQYLSSIDIPFEIYEFSPFVNDDLIEKFKEVFKHYSIKEIIKLTGFTKSTINKLQLAFFDNEINSIIQLRSIKGIGEQIIKECYNFAMNYHPDQITFDMFSNDIKKDKVINQISDKPSKYLTIKEKTTLTGLSEHIIKKIEMKDDRIKIRDVKIYCKALNLNFSDFISKNY